MVSAFLVSLSLSPHLYRRPRNCSSFLSIAAVCRLCFFLVHTLTNDYLSSFFIAAVALPSSLAFPRRACAQVLFAHKIQVAVCPSTFACSYSRYFSLATEILSRPCSARYPISRCSIEPITSIDEYRRFNSNSISTIRFRQRRIQKRERSNLQGKIRNLVCCYQTCFRMYTQRCMCRVL